MGAKRVLLIGNYGVGNLGDDAIFAGIVEDLKAISFDGELQLFHGGSEINKELYAPYKKSAFVPFGLRSRFKKTRKEGIKAIQNADLVILGGGGLFTDDEKFYAPLLWWLQVQAARRLKVPYICYGQSVGPLRKPWSRWITRWVFQNAAGVHVRDSQSLFVLENLGLERKIHLGTDAALSWLLKQQRKPAMDSKILLNLRLWPGFERKSWQSILHAIESAFPDSKLELFTTDLRNREEIEALKALERPFHQVESIGALWDLIQTGSLVVSTRLHATLFALSSHKPTLALSYSSKVQGILENLNPRADFRWIPLENGRFKAFEISLKEFKNRSESLQIKPETLIEENREFLSSALGLH